jgi:hypothetical protein
LSRFSETPTELLIELQDNNYISLGEPHDAAVRIAKDSILGIVPKTEIEAVDLKRLLESAKLPRATVQRAVDELVRAKRLTRIGEGKRGNPYRYFTPEINFRPTST